MKKPASKRHATTKTVFMVRAIQAASLNHLHLQHQKEQVCENFGNKFNQLAKMYATIEFTDRTSSTSSSSSTASASDTTKTSEDLGTTNRESNSFGTTSEIGTTNFGTSTSVGTTHSQSTPAVTRPETAGPSSTSTRRMTTPVPETTHYHKTSTTEMDNSIADNR